MDNDKFCFAIDRGGTFTDVYARCPGGKVRIMKLLSEDPQRYSDAPTEGIRRILEEETRTKLNPKESLDPSQIEWIRMGTTVATNALLERKGEKMALAVTAGLRDLLYIGNQSRPNIFDLSVRCPDVLYADVIEVEERVVLTQDKCRIAKQCPTAIGVTGEQVEIWTPLNESKLRQDLNELLQKGIKSIAVVLAHSYTFHEHEILVGKIAEEMGFSHVSLSSQVMPMVKMVPRGFTATADAYLTPHVKRYVSSFASGFKNNLKDTSVLFMQSDGGLTPMRRFNGSRAILSGPAGGVVGHAMTTYGKITNQPIIGFDMGGTSTDVSRYDGNYEHVFESTTAGVTIQAPQLDVNTVAAGGGSVLFYRSGMFVVGPESAGSNPGPTCYRKGGPLTVTDANLCLGRLLPMRHQSVLSGVSESSDTKPDRSLSDNESILIQASKRTTSTSSSVSQTDKRPEKYPASKPVTPEPKNKPPPLVKRGQKYKLKKMKKYKDQDESDRILAMELLKPDGLPKEPKHTKKGKKPTAKNVKKPSPYVLQKPQQLADGQIIGPEPLKAGSNAIVKPEEVVEQVAGSDDEKEEQNMALEDANVLNSLTGIPIPEDDLTYCVPVCAPYNSVTNYKYKVKLIPGTGKRGKAVKTAIAMFLNDKTATQREKDLLRSLKDQDVSRNIPGKVKMSAPQLQRIKKR